MFEEKISLKKEKISIQHIKHLVYQGGSVKGIAYAGAWEALLKQGLQPEQLKKIAGTSAGAITALLLCLGIHEPSIINDYVKEDFKKFLDEPALRDPLLQSKDSLKNKQGGGFFSNALFSTVAHSPTASKASSQLAQAFGLFTGESFRLWVEALIFKQTKVQHLTFAELHKLHEKYPALYKDLYVMGVNVNTSLAEKFCYETTPDCIISDAVRISMSIPFVFKPHQVWVKNKDGERELAQSEDLYVDGGITNNYPITIFDGSAVNDTTLGFSLGPTDSKLFFENEGPAPHSEIFTFLPYILAVLRSIYHKQKSDLMLKQEQWRTVFIDTCGVEMLDFDLSEKDKNKLIDSGNQAVQEFFGAEMRLEQFATKLNMQ